MSNTYTTIKLIHETYSVSEVSSFISTDSRFSDQKDHLSTCAKSSRPSPNTSVIGSALQVSERVSSNTLV